MTPFEAFKQDFKRTENRVIYDNLGNVIHKAIMPYQITTLTRELKRIRKSKRCHEFNLT